MSNDRATGAPADSRPPSTVSPLLRVGRYVLFEKIASGGMASVHFARMDGSVGFSKTVAVKRLHENFANDPEFRAMFLDEARLASRIRHTNVVQPLDVLAIEGQLLVALEYVHGESLNGLLSAAFARKEAPHPAIAATIVAGALHGLHAAHEAKDRNGELLGLIHRDISPHNILVGDDGVPRVIDFGIAKAINRAQTTEAGQLKGKIAYMAPEQLSTEPISAAVDQWAAGVVLWELLTCKRLHEGVPTIGIYERIIGGPLPGPREVNRAVPASIDAIVRRALEKNPANRFPSAREMALALERAIVPAPASAVAAWVDRLVGEKLEARAAKLLQIEQAVLEPTDPFEFSAPTVAEPFRGPFATASEGAAHGPAADTATHPEFVPPVAPLLAAPVPPVAPALAAPVAPVALAPSVAPPAPSMAVAATAPAAPVAPPGLLSIPLPTLEAAPPPASPIDEVRTAAARIASDRPLIKKLAIGAVALIVVPLAARAIFRAQVGAAINDELTNRGVLVEGDREIESDRIVWSNATILVKGAGSAGATDRFSLKATKVIVRRQGRVVTSVAIDAPVLELAGDPADRLGRLEGWRTRFAGVWNGEDGRAIEVRVRNGKLDFRDLFGPGSQLTATFDGGVTGKKIGFDLSDVRFHGTGTGPDYGPLRGTLHDANEGAAIDLSLVTTPPKPVVAGQKAPVPQLVLAFGAKTPPTLALDLPATPRTELAVPAAFFEGVPESATLAGTAFVTFFPTGPRGQGRFSLTGILPTAGRALNGSLTFGVGSNTDTTADGAIQLAVPVADGETAVPLRGALTGKSEKTPSLVLAGEAIPPPPTVPAPAEDAPKSEPLACVPQATVQTSVSFAPSDGHLRFKSGTRCVEPTVLPAPEKTPKN